MPGPAKVTQKPRHYSLTELLALFLGMNIVYLKNLTCPIRLLVQNYLQIGFSLDPFLPLNPAPAQG